MSGFTAHSRLPEPRRSGDDQDQDQDQDDKNYKNYKDSPKTKTKTRTETVGIKNRRAFASVSHAFKYPVVLDCVDVDGGPRYWWGGLVREDHFGDPDVPRKLVSQPMNE
jgi:hypothetical protein